MSGTAKLVTELVGTRLGDRYVLEEKIGAGGFAVVYRSRDTRIHKQVAIKVLDRAKIQSLRDIARFRNEAAIAAAIDDQHVIKITDYGEEGTIFYYVMELLRGHTLRSVIAMHDRLHWQRACDICEQVLLALELAHEHTIIHRDVKPENIFIEFRRGTENVKLLDLGIAKVLHEWDGLVGNLSTTGDFIGSPAYMAPEQAKGTKHCDFRVDLYAVGVVLYELITGGVPYRGGSAWETMLLHVEGALPAIHARAPGIECPPELEQIVQRALAKDSAARFQTATEMGEALRAVRLSRPAIAWEPLWTPPTAPDHSHPIRQSGEPAFAKTTPAEHRREDHIAHGSALPGDPAPPVLAPARDPATEPARATETDPALAPPRSSPTRAPASLAHPIHALPLRWRTRLLLGYLTLGSLVVTCATSTLATVTLHPDIFNINYNNNISTRQIRALGPEFEEEEIAAAPAKPTPADLLVIKSSEKPAEEDSIDPQFLAPPEPEPEPEPAPEPEPEPPPAPAEPNLKKSTRPARPVPAVKKAEPEPLFQKTAATGPADDDLLQIARRPTMAILARKASAVIKEACLITPFSPLKEAKYTVVFRVHPMTGDIEGVSATGEVPPLRQPDCVLSRARALVKTFARASDLKTEFRHTYVVVR